MTKADIPMIAQIIQLAVAPVFLLAGVGGLLNVVAMRLSRVVDRMRALEEDIPTAGAEIRRAEISELAAVDRRMRYCHWAIALFTAAALFVCLVVMILFVANLVTMDFSAVVSLLFIAAMGSLTLGLLLFLAEVTIATRSVRVSEQFLSRGKGSHDEGR